MIRNIRLNTNRYKYEVVYQPKDKEEIGIIQTETYGEAACVCNAFLDGGDMAYIRKKEDV